jgi:DNA invertase Pin-like site-specific DNA recombinase
VAYVRVSWTGRNLGRQLENVRDADWIFEKKVSGGSWCARVALLDFIQYVREGDVLRVASMHRFARLLDDLRDTDDSIGPIMFSP